MAVGTVSASVLDEPWQLIETKTPTSGTTVTFSSFSGYKSLMFTFKGLSATAASGKYYMRFNGDNGSNYNSFVSGYGANSDAYSFTELYITGYTTTGNESGYVVFKNVNSTTLPKIIVEGSSYVMNKFSGIWLNESDAVTSIAIAHNSGSAFSAGTIKLYGIPA